MSRHSIRLNALLRALLLFIIRLYRRRLSGRGPFARVSCTFGGLESCSTFGERVALESPSTFTAIVRITRRLRRCRQLSLFRLSRGRLGWGRGYDALLEGAPAESIIELERSLRRDGETPRVSAAVGRAARRVAIESGRMQRGRVDRAVTSSALALPWRDAAAARRVWRRRRTSRLIVSPVAALAAATLAAAGAGGPAVMAMLIVLALYAGFSAVAAHGALKRLELMEVLAAVELPRVALPACHDSSAPVRQGCSGR